jgi:hypothetical protein
MSNRTKTARENHQEFKDLVGPGIEPELRRGCIHESDPNVRAYLSFDEYVFQYPTFAEQARRNIDIRGVIAEVEIALLRIFNKRNYEN